MGGKRRVYRKYIEQTRNLRTLTECTLDAEELLFNKG